MPSLFMNSASKDGIILRISAIQEDTQAQWGTMNAPRAVAHLLHSLKVPLGEASTEYHGNFFKKNVMRLLAFHTPMPWPKGKIPTAPGYEVDPEGSFEEQKKNLVAAVEKFLQLSESEPEREVLHPNFGVRKLAYWQRLNGRHFEHHLNQFGV